MPPPGPTIRRIDPPDEPVPVRAAEQQDVPRIAVALTLALGDSRWTRWALPADGRTQRLTRWHELVAGHRGVTTGAAWVSDDGASVASWEPPPGAPGTQPVPRDVSAALARELPHLHAERWTVVAATAERVAAARPAEPHWWLAHLGTRPTARRRGRAAAVLTPVLGRCDDTGTLAAAAVYTWAGARFLRRFGFEVSEALRTTDGELPVWVLVRPAIRTGGAGA